MAHHTIAIAPGLRNVIGCDGLTDPGLGILTSLCECSNVPEQHRRTIGLQVVLLKRGYRSYRLRHYVRLPVRLITIGNRLAFPKSAKNMGCPGLNCALGRCNTNEVSES